LELDAVAAQLKLSRRQIEALEADRYWDLPGNTFVRGFVRNYARLLEMDSAPLLGFLDQHLPREVPQVALPKLTEEALPNLGLAHTPRHAPFLIAVLLGVLIAGGGLTTWIYRSSMTLPDLTLVRSAPADEAPSNGRAAPLVQNSAAEAVPRPVAEAPVAASVPEPGIAAPATVEPPAAAAASAPQPAAVQFVGDVRVVAQEDSWVMVMDATGRRLLNGIVKAGESREVAGTPPYRVRIGNGPRTQLFYKGQPTDLTPYIKVNVADLELR
jgi:cytoskeleton protein RodZ